MKRIYSYVLRYDDGAAPNPFWEVCTLTICKPVIRKRARIGDWVIGTGSKNVKLSDRKVCNFSDSVVYAMKITDIKTLKEYDDFCKEHLDKKIPKWNSKDWKLRVGDCIYDYSKNNEPTIRESVHKEGNKETDLGGCNALLSNDFYYFGAEARPLPLELKELIKRNQGYKKIENLALIEKFEEWIRQFETNKLYADPQMYWMFEKTETEKELLACARRDCENYKEEQEETLC